MSGGQTADADPVDRLERAAEELSAVRERVENRDGDVERVARAYRDVTGVLERYESRATDWDDPEGYIEFRDELSDTVGALPAGMATRDAFEEADELLKTSGLTDTLDSEEFDAAREALAPARSYADLVERRRQARQAYREARRSCLARKRELDDRVEELERLDRLASADLEAPVEQLREPIEAYNDAVADAFQRFKREESARELLGFVGATGSFPLVGYRQPPDRLRRFVESDPAGEQSVSRLLELADYSRSKLTHYVDDPGELKGAVATNRTYLERLDAGPLQVEWPPPSADELRFRLRELVACVGRFAPDAVVARLHDLRGWTGDDRYGRLRRSAVARAGLSTDERERVRSGEVGAELADAERERERLAGALADHDPL
jgi:hypothetical protein